MRRRAILEELPRTDDEQADACAGGGASPKRRSFNEEIESIGTGRGLAGRCCRDKCHELREGTHAQSHRQGRTDWCRQSVEGGSDALPRRPRVRRQLSENPTGELAGG